MTTNEILPIEPICPNCNWHSDSQVKYCKQCGQKMPESMNDSTTDTNKEFSCPKDETEMTENIAEINIESIKPRPFAKIKMYLKRVAIAILLFTIVTGFSFVFLYINERQAITINTDNLMPYDAEQTIFRADGNLDVLSGTVEGLLLKDEITATIRCGDLELATVSTESAGNWSIAKPTLIKGTNNITIVVRTFYGKKLSTGISIISTTDANIDGIVLDTNDDDSDKLLNWQELAAGTDLNNPDSDEDELTDYEEIYVTLTNPLVYDTYSLELSDAEADLDNDDISNIDEIRLYETDPLNSDTDGDSLSDYEEAFTYKTDPLIADTDGDGADDGWEVLYGFDPLVFNDSFYQTISTGTPNEIQTVTATVTIALEGKQVGSLEIQSVSAADDLTLSPAIPGYMGAAYNFSVDGDFDSADISFEYDVGLGVISDKFQPRIYYYDETTGDLVELPDQKAENGKVTASVDHFSKYILLNSWEFNAVWDIYIRSPQSAVDTSMEPIDLLFVIDESNSMESSYFGSPNDQNRIRVEAAKKFTEALSNNDRAGIIGFNSSPRLLSELEHNMKNLREQIDKIESNGGTAIHSALDMALNELMENGRSDSQKIIIALTDGEDSPEIEIEYYDEVIKRALDNDIIIYTIGLGENINARLLERIAYKTNGRYFHASEADEVYEGFEFIRTDSIDYTTDSDEDEIPDYYSRLIFEGKLRLQNGSAELMGTDFSINKDMDEDGLVNGKEIQIVESGGRVFIKMISHPLLKDSDFDSIHDKSDKQPLLANYFNNDNVDYLMRSSEFEYSKYADGYQPEIWDLLADGMVCFLTSTNLQNDYTMQMADFFMSCTSEEYIDDLAFKDMKKRNISATWSNIGTLTNNALAKLDLLEEALMSSEDERLVFDEIEQIRGEAGLGVRELIEFLNEAIDLGNETRSIESFEKCVNKNIEASLEETLLRSTAELIVLYNIYQQLDSFSADIFKSTGFQIAVAFANVVDIIFTTKDLHDDQKLLWDLAKGIAYDSANQQAFMQNLDILTELRNITGSYETRRAAQFIIDALYANWNSVKAQQREDALLKASGIAIDIEMALISFVPPLTAVSVAKGVFDTCNSAFGWSANLETRAQLLCLSDMTIATTRLVGRVYYSDEVALTRHLTNLVNLRILGETRFRELSSDNTKHSNASNNMETVKSFAEGMNLRTIK